MSGYENMLPLHWTSSTPIRKIWRKNAQTAARRVIKLLEKQGVLEGGHAGSIGRQAELFDIPEKRVIFVPFTRAKGVDGARRILWNACRS
jgi:hypothetical protein